MDDHLSSLRRDGFFVAKNVFAGDALRELEGVRKSVLAGIESGSIARSGQFTDGDVGDCSAFARHPPLLAIVREVLGENICLHVNRILMKDPHFHDKVVVHQDWPYFDGNTIKVNTFVALTPCNRENGMLELYRGSHRYGPVDRGMIDVTRFPEFEAVVPSLEPGDVLFADFLLWHGSVPACQPAPRILMQLAFQPAEDQSSSALVHGRLDDMKYHGGSRMYPLSEPLPTFTYTDARAEFEAGNLRAAEGYARGLNSVDSNNVAVNILLHDIKNSEGDSASAQYFLAKARELLDLLEQEISARGLEA